jgi:hypothetical protein
MTAVLVLSLCGCEAGPAFEVPPGAPRSVAVDVVLPIDIMGTYRIDTFREALRVELAKYRIRIAPSPAPPGTPTVRIELALFTYRGWQEIDVVLVKPDGAEKAAGAVRIPDASGFSVDAAAEPIAALVARVVWGRSGDALKRVSPPFTCAL